MLCRIIVLSLFAAFCASAQPAFPDTPAGRTLKAWLEAFNSGDRARMEAYIQKFDPTRPIDNQMNFRNQTGGFDLLSIDKSERTHIEFRVKEKAGPTTAIGRLDVKDADPAEVVSFGVRAMPPGVTEADFKIDAAARQRAIDGAAAMLNEFYVFPETAKKMEEAIRARQKAGEYDSITNGDAFAEKLTADLREVSHDKHLGVNFSPAVLPKGPPPGGPDMAAMRRQMERMNCGFEKAERLPPNIGYLKFNMFANPDICGPTASAAMNFLGSVDALIIDLRENGGGDPKMVAYISSYLFDERTHLNDLYHRKENKTEEFWTSTDVPGKRLGRQAGIRADRQAHLLGRRGVHLQSEEPEAGHDYRRDHRRRRAPRLRPPHRRSLHDRRAVRQSDQPDLEDELGGDRRRTRHQGARRRKRSKLLRS